MRIISQGVTLNQLLKQRRQVLRIHQEELAPKLGLSAMGLSYLERGQRKIKLELLEKWAELLDLEIDIEVRPKSPKQEEK